MRRRLALLPALVAEFPRWLEYFVDRCPFTKPEQLRCHLKAIELRRRHLSSASASSDPQFLSALYDTLRAWGLGSRGSKLLPFRQFGPALQNVSVTLAPLEGRQIDDPDLDVEGTVASIWTAVESIGVAQNKAPLVAGSKALHHLLPDLVPPMDRAYTQTFFGWNNPQFQYDQAGCFRLAYSSIVYVARQVRPGDFVGTAPWHTSASKVLDNGLIGLVCAVDDGLLSGQPLRQSAATAPADGTSRA